MPNPHAPEGLPARLRTLAGLLEGAAANDYPGVVRRVAGDLLIIAAVEADRTALAGEWRVPEGWRLVPVEATEAMKQAAYAQQAEFMRQLGEHCNGAPEPEDLFVLMWRAAISAAPLPKEPGHG